MADPQSQYAPSAWSPARGGVDIVPDNANDLADVVKAVRCNGAGKIKFTTAKGTVHTWDVAAGETIRVQIKRVWATGTDATGIFGYLD